MLIAVIRMPIASEKYSTGYFLQRKPVLLLFLHPRTFACTVSSELFGF